MIDVNSNINDVIQKITTGLNEITNPDQIIRTVAQTMVVEVHDRIHDRGKDSNDTPIGEYSNGYMALRTGNYKRKAKEGIERPRYNRTNDKKVVLSLTRQMENDFSVVATPEGYGLGYKNDENFKKSQYAEKTYNKKIFDLTETEKENVVKIAEFEVNKLLND